MKRVIIVGSPRTAGRSAHLAEMLFEANIDERPEDELFLVPVSEIEVGPCIGCNACRGKIDVTFKDDDGNEVTEPRHRCVFDDDMQMVYDLLDDADSLSVVCPVYFSGAPAPMKCLLDRLQPYFWKYTEDGPILPKRPLELHVVGEGGDPHGYGPLVSEVKAPLALAGFGLERILDWVGKISEQGEIAAEAVEVEVSLPLPSGRPKGDVDDGALEVTARADAGHLDGDKEREIESRQSDAVPAAQRSRTAQNGSRSRPKLDLTGAKGSSAKGGGSAKREGGRDAKRQGDRKGANGGRGRVTSQGKPSLASAHGKGSEKGRSASGGEFANRRNASSRGKASGGVGAQRGGAPSRSKGSSGKSASNRKGGRRG